MKRILKTTILSAALTVGLTSCKDALYIEQDGEMNAISTFTSTSDVEKFLNGTVYGSLDVSTSLFMSAQLTDELGMGPQNSELALSPHQFYLDVTNGSVSSIWLSSYTNINRVNRLLEGAERVTPTSDAEKVRYNHAIAQARMMRAFSYLTLTSYFSTDPKNPSALGVIYVDDVPKLADKKPRATNAEIYALIDEDIKFAEEHLQNSTSHYYIGKNFLNAFKARYYLYKGDYAKAKTAADFFVNNSAFVLTPATPTPTGTAGSATWHTNLNAYASTNPYIKLWNDNAVLNASGVPVSNGELIFSIYKPATQSWSNIGSYFASNSSKSDGSILYDMGRNIFNLYNSTPGDIRRFAYIDPTSTINASYETAANYRTSDVLIIDKYPGKWNGTQPLRNDLKVFRLSEMYFIAAEAAAETGDFATAASLIKKVRDARNYLGPVTVPTYASKQEAYKDILLERRKELFLEGHRYLDLKRAGAIAGVAIDRHPTDDLKTVPTTIAIDDYRMRSFPIPQNELQGNPNLEQNPGY